MSYNYEDLLKRARSQIPEVAAKRERLELPRLRMNVVGMRTVIHNFKEVADALNRDPQHIVKYLTGEMATAASTQEGRVIFQGKFYADTLTTLLQRYMDNFILCPVCKRPDTKVVRERRLSFIVCEACGAKSSVRNL